MIGSSVLAVDLPLPFKIQKEPLRYANHLFCFTDKPSFVKLDSDNHVVWELSKSTANIESVGIKFGMVVFLSKTGHLECYNEEFGYRVWQNESENALSFSLAYPVFIIQDKEGMGGVDFFSGQVVWKKPKFVLEDACNEPYSNQLIGLMAGQLIRLDALTGETDTLDQAPQGATHLYTAWDQNLLITGGEKIWIYNIGTGVYQESKIQLTPFSKIVGGQSVINLNPQKRTWEKWDLQSGTMVWEKEVTPSVTSAIAPSFFLSDEILVGINPNGDIDAYSYETGSRIGKCKWTSPTSSILSMTTKKGMIKIVTATQIVNLSMNPESLTVKENMDPTVDEKLKKSTD